MDNIKPTQNLGNIDFPSAETSSDAKPNRSFAGTQQSLASSAVKSETSSAAVSSNRAGLQDRAKLDLMVRSSASQLVESQSTSPPMSSADKKIVTDFVCEDPLLRQQIETYLRKVTP